MAADNDRKILRFSSFALIGIIFAFYIAYKVHAAPAAPLVYLQGTYLLTQALFLVALLLVYPPLWRWIATAAAQAMAAILLLAFANQQLLFLSKAMKLSISHPYAVNAAVFAIALLASHFIAQALFRSSPKKAALVAVLQGGMAATTIAFLLKLESWPDATPYAPPALLIAIVAPAVHVAIALLIHVLRQNRA